MGRGQTAAVEADLPARRTFDEQFWPTSLALIALGGVLMVVSAAYQPLEGAAWHLTAWPSLIGIPILVVVCIIALACIDSRRFQRTLQLSLVLAGIVHVALIVHMIETSLFSSRADQHQPRTKIAQRRPRKIIPSYHPTQLMPEEDRPRQDYEKPVEAQDPMPSREPENIVRQPAEQDRSPAEPQPVKVPEQQQTTEPNVVQRQTPNEVAPRLSPQSSQLSRQLSQSESRISELVALPERPRAEAALEARPSVAELAQKETSPDIAPRAVDASPSATSVATAQLERRMDQSRPQMPASVASTLQRTVAEPITAAPSAAATNVAATPTREPANAALEPANTAATRTKAGTQLAARPANARPVEPRAAMEAIAASRSERQDVAALALPQVTAAVAARRQARAASPVRAITTSAVPVPSEIPPAIASTSEPMPQAGPIGRAVQTAAPKSISGQIGRIAEVAVGPQLSSPGGAPARRSESALASERPAVGELATRSAPSRRSAAAPLAGGSTTVANIPEVGPTSAVAQAELDHRVGGVGPAAISRRGDVALTAAIAAPDGPGGLGSSYTPEVGISSRQARADSASLQLRSARFVRSEVGGLPAVSTTAILPTEAYSGRRARALGQTPAGGRGASGPETEEAIERGLAFLARYQLPDGGWSLQGFPEGAELASDTAATALALIAFQGAGYSHLEFQYKDVVRGGIEHLVKNQRANGDLFVPLDDASNRSVWLYSHSLGAIALCEAYGMTQDRSLRQPAQRAIDFIVASQHPERGGWRYSPGTATDTSVTGWKLMALKSGELAGLTVPRETYIKIDRWLNEAQQSPEQPHLYRYNPYAPDTAEQRHGRAASKTMTAVGLLMRLYTGWRRDNASMVRGAEYLAENLPANGTQRQPLRDTYYWYYATLVMNHMGGRHLQAWNEQLRPLLIDSQSRQGNYAGSWDPALPLPDRWGPHAGRIYVTTMNLLSLEVQYRKLPLYEDAVK